jgi:hypothetical protein
VPCEVLAARHRALDQAGSAFSPRRGLPTPTSSSSGWREARILGDIISPIGVEDREVLK